MTAKFSRFRIQLFAIAFILTGINAYAQPEIPVLSSPADYSVQLPTRPVLSWYSSSGADKYALQVSGDSLFGTSSLVYNDTSITDTFRQVGPLANNRTYYWRVSAKNGDGSSGFSGKWRFTTMQAPAVQATTIISSFTSPGSLPRGLAWDGDYLWIIDDVKNIYKCDTSGNIKKTIAFGDNFDRDISWDGTGLWIGGASDDGGALKIDANGNWIDSLPVHYSDSSGIEWDGRYFWFGDYGSSYIRMHKKDGSLFRNWPTSGITGHPTGISYDGIRLWIGGSGGTSSNYIYKYSILGELIYNFDLNNIGIETAPGSFISLAWDGKSLWYASDKSFYIYRLSIPYYHSAPSAPVLTSPANGADEQDLTLTLRWNSSLDATIYHLQVSTDPAFSTVIFNDSTITDTWKQVGPLEYYTTYYWHVSAKNCGGKSAFSGAFNFTTFNDPPSEPSNLKVIPGDNQVTLRWNPNTETDLYKYRIYRDISSPATTLIDSVFGLVPDTFYTDNNVTNADIYYYRITALDIAGNESSYSNEVLTMPQALTDREFQPDENAVLLFHMNEPGGSTVYDFSGNSNNGSVTGTTIVDGKYGKARSFIPPTDVIHVQHDSSLNFGTGSYTLEFWVNASPSTSGGHILHKRGNTPLGTTGRGWFTTFGYDGTIYISVYNDPNLDGEEGNSGIGSNKKIADGLWHHVAFVNTYDTIFCYIDGELDNYGAVSTPGSPDNDATLEIGVPSGDEQFTGFVDEIRISNKARTLDEFNIFRPPDNPVIIVGDQQITLCWDPVTETSVSKYNVYRDTVSPCNTLFDSVVGSPPDTFYIDSDLIIGNTYYYRISAVDNDGYESVVSEELNLGYNIVILDGVKDPFWETVTAHIHLGQDELVEGEMDNEDDFSADLYLAYDSVYLFGFLEVKDDSVSSKSYDNWWENDAFSLKLDPITDSVIIVDWDSWQEPNWLDIINIEMTAQTGLGEERNGRGNTIIKRALTDSGYVVEFAIPAGEMVNNNTDPQETILLEEGTQVGFYFEMADQDEESYREATLAWGHSSVSYNSAGNVTHYGSMTFLAGNQIGLSNDNLVMLEDLPYIQVPHIHSSHWLQGKSEGWSYHSYVYVNDPQGQEDIDSVWVEGPGGGLYRMYDDGTNGDDWPPGDGRYRLDLGYDLPLPTGVYIFHVIDKSGNHSAVSDSLTSGLEYPRILIPVHNSIISEPDFLIDWDEVPNVDGYSIEVNLSTNWKQYWQTSLAPDSTSAKYNDNGEGKELIEGEVYYLSIHVGDGRNVAHTMVKIAYMIQSNILIDGIKDPYWDIVSGHIHLGEEELVGGKADDEDDFSADVYLAYDSVYLYGFIDVKDDSISSKANWNWWENDAISLKFDTYPDSVIPVPYNSGEEPNSRDIISIDITAETGFGDERNGNESTILDRAYSDTGYVIEFAISAAGLVNYNTNPSENVLLQEGTQVGFYFEMADQDVESWHEAVIAWGHTSANLNSGSNVTQFGSMTFLADNQLELSHDNLVMSEDQPYIQVPHVSANHNIDENLNEWWDYYFYVYANTLQGLNNIDSVWVEGPDGSHYHLYDDNTRGDDYKGDGRYCYNQNSNVPPATGIYHFYAIDQAGKKVSESDTLTGLLDCPENLIPANNTIVSEPDFLIDWDEVPGATGYWIDINLASDWDHYWNIGLLPGQTSVHYNVNGEGRELVEGEIYILQVNAGNDRNSSQTRTKFIYAKQGLILIDGLKDSFWETVTGHIHLGEDEVVWGNIDDENDCSADVYLTYDSLFLYGLIEVTDDVMGPEDDWWWDNDAFILRLDIDPATIATDQNTSDIFSLEFTARADAHDQRNGNDYTLLSRNITDNGYILEFAVSVKGLVNTSPDPDETIDLKEGTQVGFFFHLADEDSVRGRETELAWGHYSANFNSGSNVSQYGGMTFLADNQIQLSHDNLVMDDYQPFIQIAFFYSNHDVNTYLNESWSLGFGVYINDPQGLDNIDSVWVESQDGTIYKLTDETDCGGYPGDGTYTYGNSYNTPFAVGDYYFYVVNKSGNTNSVTDTLPEFISCPEIIFPANNLIVTDPGLLIDWNDVQGASQYWINISSVESWGSEWIWGDFLGSPDKTSVQYAGPALKPGKAYRMQVSAGYGRTCSGTEICFAYRTGNLRTIYVNTGNTSDVEYGNQDFPFNTIQEGIDATLYGDTVLVYPGTYIENVNIHNTHITLGSLALITGDTSFITKTIIDGNQSGSVISVWDSWDTINIIGFTITNGSSDNGGGINIWDSNVNLYQLKIIDNYANYCGGGICGGICCAANIKIDNVLIHNNSSGVGGGIFLQNGTLELSDSRLLYNYSQPGGSAIQGDETEIYISNTVIAKNYGSWSLELNSGHGSILNSTITDNPDGAFSDSDIELWNCIEWNNNQNNLDNLDSIKYSLIEGGALGTGNIDANPMFIDAEAGDYRLHVSSPCINMGTPDTTGLNLPLKDLAGNPRIYDRRIDMGAYEFNEELIALVQYADTAITIDGKINENIWQRSDKYYINKPFTGEVFDGPEDLSAYWKAAWDEDGIYFLVEVTADDTLVTDGTNGEVYEQDRVDIYLDMNTDSLKDGNGPSTGISSGSPTNGHYQFSFNRRAEFDTLSDWQTGCKIAIIENEEDATSVEELFVPWSLITDADGNEFVPDENINIGFDVYVADNDGPANGEARNRKVWVHDGIYGDAARFNMDYCGKIQIIRQSDEVLNLKVTASSTTICPGDEVQLNVIPDNTDGTYYYTWTSDLPGPAYSFSNPVVAPTVTTTYYINVTDLTYSTKDSVTITVLPLPVVDAGADTSISYNTAVTLNGSVTGGSGFYSYDWSPADSFNYSFIPNPTTHKLHKSNLFTLSAMDYGSGCTNTDQVMVTVTGGALDADISIFRDTICQGESVKLLAIPTGGTGNYSYSWSSDPQGFTSSVANPSDTPSGNLTYSLVISDGINSDSTSLKIIVHSVSEPESPDVSVCYGEPILPLTALGNNITWYTDNTLSTITGMDDTLQTELTSVGEYSFYVTQTDKNCVSPAAEVILRIIELPEVTINVSEIVIDPGETVQLIAGGADYYSWTPSAGLNRTDGDTVRATPDENTKYTVTGTNTRGCSNIAEASIYVYCVECDQEEIIFDTAGFIGYCPTNRVYPENVDCYWLIYPSGALSIYLAFDTIDIKPGDYVRVYNGFNVNSELLGEFDNDHKPTGQIQSGSMLYIWFHSNESGTGLGFRARYRTNHPVGIEEYKFISGLNIYPNPVTGLLNIEFTSRDETEFTISVFNTLLQLLKHKNIQVMAGRNREVLDMTGLPSGVYYLQILSKKGRLVRKIIVR